MINIITILSLNKLYRDDIFFISLYLNMKLMSENYAFSRETEYMNIPK